MVWLILTLIFVMLAIHSFVFYPLSLWVVAAFRRQPVPVTSQCPARIAILFCAHNEERVITEKLQNCLALQAANPSTVIYVYTDGCIDRTVEIVRSFGPRINLFEGKERRGKSFGMNHLVDMARQGGADILFFTDANVILRDDVLQVMQAEFAPPTVGCVTGHLEYVNGNESATALVGSRYWALDETIKRLETATGSCVGADGSIFAIRAKLFRKVPENIIDDFFTSMSVLCDGWRCVYGARVIAYERSATRSGEEFRRKVRIACRAFNCHRLLWPRLVRLPAWDLYKYVSHKLLRWLTVFWLTGAMISAAMFVLTAGFSALTVFCIAVPIAAVAALVAWMPGRPWVYVRESLLALAATGLGLIKSMQGERFQTWSHAASTREQSNKPGDDVIHGRMREPQNLVTPAPTLRDSAASSHKVI
jgi:cellulose synthase/poly-beta-1,6-N-acetylglucosamine synthase-like glycosyltransferase